MQRIKFLFIIAGLVTALFFGAPAFAGAQTWRLESGEFKLGKEQLIPGDLIFVGDRVEIDGVVEGDLVLFVGQAVITGKVNGSVVGLVSRKLTNSGIIEGNLRGLFNEVLVSKTGTIRGSITVMAVRLISERDSVIERGILGRFLEVDLGGRIIGPVSINSALASKLSGTIEGDLQIDGAPVKWIPPLSVFGRVTDSTGYNNNPSTINGIKLGGGYHLREKPVEEEAAVLKGVALVSFIWFLGTLLISLVFYRFFPRTAWAITEPSAENLRRSFLIGLVGAIGLPLLIILLIVSIVGLPLAILLGLFYLFLLLFARVPLNLWAGRLVFKSRLNPVLTIILGGLLLMLIGFIPIIGFLMQLFLWLLGAGMIIGNIRLQVNKRLTPHI